MNLASLVDKPLMQNPLAGGGAMIRPQESQLQGDALVEQMQMRMQQRDVKTPAFLAYFKDVMDTKGYPTKTMEEYGFQPTLSGLLEQANPISGAQQATPGNPFGQLSQVDSEEELIQSGQFLPDIPKNIASPGLPPSNNFVDDMRDKTLPTLQFPEGTGPLQTVQGPEDTQPFDRIGQQMINFEDMFGPLNTRLNKIEEGIASLLKNRGQGLNMNTMPSRNMNNFFQEPIGRFPFRSFYG